LDAACTCPHFTPAATVLNAPASLDGHADRLALIQSGRSVNLVVAWRIVGSASTTACTIHTAFHGRKLSPYCHSFVKVAAEASKLNGCLDTARPCPHLASTPTVLNALAALYRYADRLTFVQTASSMYFVIVGRIVGFASTSACAINATIGRSEPIIHCHFSVCVAAEAGELDSGLDAACTCPHFTPAATVLNAPASLDGHADRLALIQSGRSVNLVVAWRIVGSASTTACTIHTAVLALKALRRVVSYEQHAGMAGIQCQHCDSLVQGMRT